MRYRVFLAVFTMIRPGEFKIRAGSGVDLRYPSWMGLSSRQISIAVERNVSQVEIRFDPPASIMVFKVRDSAGETIWEIMPLEMRSMPVVEGSVKVWKLEEAPKGLLELAQQAQENYYRRVEEKGPSKLPLRSIQYGTVPPGYRESTPAKPLGPGTYSAIVFSEQGRGRAKFDVLPYAG